MKNEKEEVTMDTIETLRIMRDYEQRYANKMDNLEEMDKVLGRCSLPKRKQEDTENMNRSITNSETETMFIKKLPTNKRPGPDAFTGMYAVLSHVRLFGTP